MSVGMPVYNGADMLKESIEAILKQSFQDIELIISDNASTDETEGICREFILTDVRVRYYRNSDNLGVTENYNRVFQHARGEYFKWASCGDLCTRDYIERCVDTLDRRTDVVLCYSKTGLFDAEITHAEDYEDNLNLQEEDPLSRFEHLCDRIKLNNVMYGVIRSKALGQTQLHRAFPSSDINLMAELTLHGKFVELPDRLFFRRMTAQAAAAMQSEIQVQERYWPRHKNAKLFVNWKINLGHLVAVYNSPLSYGGKCKLYLKQTRRLIWCRKELIKEILSALP